MITPEKRKELIERFRTDLIGFGRFISIDEPDLKSPDFHYEIANNLMNPDLTRIGIQAPRGYAKSSIIACWFVLWYLIYGDGKKYVVILSKARPEAQKRIRAIKSVIEHSEQFKMLYGYYGKETTSLWNQDTVLWKNVEGSPLGGCKIEAKGLEEQMRGLNELQVRPTLFVWDDGEDENNTATIESIENNFDRFLVILAGLDVKRGRVVAIGTPVAENCTIERIAKMKDFLFKKYPIADFENKKALWDEMHTFEEVRQLQQTHIDIGKEYMFNSEYMCIVKGKDDQKFKNEDMMWYDGKVDVDQNGDAYLTFKEKNGVPCNDVIPVNIFLGIDPATSTNARADFTVIMPIAVDKSRNYYVLPYMRGRFEPDETCEKIVQLFKILKPRYVTLETTGAQKVFISAIEIMFPDLYIPGLRAKNNPTQSKSKRYQDILQPIHRQHKIYMMKSMEELRSEMIMFGSNGVHDDTIDGLYWAITKSFPPEHDIKEKPKYKRPVRTDMERSWMSKLNC